MGGVGEYEALHGHPFQIVPGDACGQLDATLGVLHEKGANHSEVSIRPHASFVVGHGVLASETTAGFVKAIGSLTGLEVVFHVGGEVGQHL